MKQGEEGTPAAEICRKAGISQATYFSWKRKYAGRLPDEMMRLKQLEDENAGRKKIVADLTLDLEPEPDPDPPVPEVAGDPAAEASARLEGELAVMRRAVQHLAAERADIVIPDYGATPTEMVKRLGEVDESLGKMADHPAMQMTPDSIGQPIAAAAEALRRSDHDRISQTRSDLNHASREIHSVAAHARTAAEQRRQLYQVAGGALLAGILLWSVLPGTIARAMPES